MKWTQFKEGFVQRVDKVAKSAPVQLFAIPAQAALDNTKTVITGTADAVKATTSMPKIPTFTNAKGDTNRLGTLAESAKGMAEAATHLADPLVSSSQATKGFGGRILDTGTHLVNESMRLGSQWMKGEGKGGKAVQTALLVGGLLAVGAFVKSIFRKNTAEDELSAAELKNQIAQTQMKTAQLRAATGYMQENGTLPKGYDECLNPHARTDNVERYAQRKPSAIAQGQGM
jgi:hypothetical protein